MKTLKAFALIGLMAVALSGCAALQNAVGEGVVADGKKAAVAALTTYADVYQPAVIFYGRLPDCPAAPVCKERAVLTQMQAADRVAVRAINDAKVIIDGASSGTSAGQLAALQTALANAQLIIASSGALSMKGN